MVDLKVDMDSTEKKLYADIIIDVSVDALDRSFQYRIPEALKDRIATGSKVSIPFGNGNRVITGYVVGISDIPKIDDQRIKDIDSVCDKEIGIEDRMIALAFWMKEHFGSTANEALKCVIPVKKIVKNKLNRLILPGVSKEELSKEIAVAEKRHHTAKERLLKELVSEYEEGLQYDLVTGKFGISAATLASLQKNGIIEIKSSVSYRNFFGKAREDAGDICEDIVLNEEQLEITEAVTKDLRNGRHEKYLIHGVTGSGKTEVYLKIIDEVVKSGKSVIMLIPEIALTYQTVKRFYKRFGERISVINSRLSAGERYDQYLRAKNGETDIVIGPRSALFTPFDNLGLIIIDEEHEGSYKSENSPKYSTREVAFKRALMEGASVILGSATPSLESYLAAKEGRIKLFELNKRAGGAELPRVWVEDLREELKAGNRSIFSRRLKTLIRDRLEKKEQIMLFINRRGHSGFVNCRSCGHVVKCPHCDVSMTYHNTGKLVCHYCGHETEMLKNCPECGSQYIGTFGTGTQKVEELLKKEFPSARVLRMDYDTTRVRESYDEILSGFANQEADILVGTQMIVKGHDFHKVTLVGVLLADMSLYTEDFRSGEKTFQLLSQAAGRAGRGQNKGDVVIQTYNPSHYAVEAAAEHDYKKFYEEEISFRRLMNYPPAWNMLKIILLSECEDKLLKETKRVEEAIKREAEYAQKAGKGRKIKIFGPSRASVYRVNDIFRMNFFLKSDEYSVLTEIKDKLMSLPEEEKEVSMQFDFNPNS